MYLTVQLQHFSLWGLSGWAVDVKQCFSDICMCINHKTSVMSVTVTEGIPCAYIHVCIHVYCRCVSVRIIIA